jgi:hypothetical protein
MPVALVLHKALPKNLGADYYFSSKSDLRFNIFSELRSALHLKILPNR